MPRSQLENDLMHNASDRLSTWRRDTSMRCEAVDIHPQIQIAMVFSCLVGELVRIATFVDMNEGDFGTLMQHALREYKEKAVDAKNRRADVEKNA